MFSPENQTGRPARTRMQPFRRRRHRAGIAFLAFVLSFGFTARLPATDNWPQFRGPDGNGHADSPGLPLQWSETNGVRWKTPIHDKGWSSPVIWADQIWVSTASEDGHELFAVCLDRATGRVERDLKLFDVANPQFCHKFNSYASPTPVIEEGRIYVTFGSPGTACLDTETGRVLWDRRDLVCNHFRGAGSSPILYGNLLIMNFDGSDFQYVIALDKRTGKTVWKTDRSIDYQDLTPEGKPEGDGDFRKAFSTPHVARVNGVPMLFSIGAKAAYAYEPLTGKEIWRVEERGQHSASTRPVVGEGLVIYPTGFSKGQLLAVRPGGRGNVTATHVAWRVKRSVPNKPSVLLVDGSVYMVDDGGIASCLEAKTGRVVWSERVGGNYSASPIYANGQIYCCSEEGKTTVFAASREFKALAVNQIDDGIMASPAVSGNALYLRGKSGLYCIED
jgi:outer membrane protein assembly factor BamB